MGTTDHLGREISDSSPKAQTVTAFAVEQGTLDGGDEGVKDTLAEEKRRAEAGTKRAERISSQLAPEAPRSTRTTREDDSPGARAGAGE